jgi:hypothetical protein
MKQENNIEHLFNTDPLLNDLNKVIQNGLNNLLSNYIENYKLYEETHNCIMNLPSVKREIAKKYDVDEIYADLPDLISISSDNDISVNEYTRIPLQDDLYQEEEKFYKELIENRDKEISDLKNQINLLFEDNNKKYSLFYKQKELYENALEKCNKEIDDLKNQINSCVKQHVICDLTHQDDDADIINEPSQEVVVEIKQEKENIILHIEENSVQTDDEEEDVDEEEDEEAAEDEVAIEDEEEEVVDEEPEEDEEEPEEDEEEEADEADEEVEEADEEVEEAVEEEEVDDEEEEEADEQEDEEADEEEEDSQIEKNEEAELSEDEVETEKSDSEDEGEEEELFEIEIDGVTYCTENEENGFIYVLDEDGNVGETTGYLKNGEPFFN